MKRRLLLSHLFRIDDWYVSEIGEFVAFARRSGDTWFLAVMNGVEARKSTQPLTFLRDGTYHAVQVQDSGDTVELVRRNIHPEDSLTLDLPPGGGTLVRFSR